MKTEKNDYSRMKRKVFIQMVIVLTASAVAVLILYNFLQGKFGVWTIRLISFVSGISYDRALEIYTAIFRNHWTEFMFLAMGIVFLCLFHFSLTWFGKYFDQINKGIHSLLGTEHEAIKMSPEMKSVEENLNTVQRTLEQQRAEASLSEQKKDDLIMYLAHDIKTPLTSIVGYLSVLAETREMPEVQREKCIRISLEKANRLEKLINEFFEITRFHRQDIVISKKEIDLNYLLIQLVDEFHPQMEADLKRAEINIKEDVRVYGDADYLARAFQNLLRNAITYSDKNSVIHIGACLQRDNAIIAVTNEGETISPEVQAHIFEKFYRADNARQANTGGSGLGLAIAKNIIALHNGSICVKSENRKTTFSISLPAVVKKEMEK